ncbi:MAG TPA: CBS domain-containing protein [Candidatus Avoscillospira stercorigallinarum]|uniref:CBS domain-containing protein n=1 Tax=Candidatus Avoscillospira stercorigallinarum TaxID=2840708 RepID=A0A9D0Z4N8_9FIRM|nr:CBS domain-containing protein [Candidatus Avoscillospira stercorigallinarum]
MEVKQVMNREVIAVSPEEPVSVAARLMTRHNVGALPVRDRDGSLCGILTDRDVVTRCVALERPLQETSVARVMTARVATVPPTASLDQAAALLSREQVRRLPVVEGRSLVGMVTLSDLSRQAPAQDTADVLREITANIKHL